MGSDGSAGGFSATFEDGVLKLKGELDLHAVQVVVGRPLLELVDTSNDVVADLSELTFIDSFGLTELVRIARAMDGHKLIIRGAGDHPRKVFELTGIDAVDGLEIEPA